LQLQGKQEESLQARLDDLDGRLARLASLRASYGSNLAEMENRTEQLRQAEDDLSRAEVSQVGADAASLIGRIDAPTVGTLPAGPGPKTIVLVGVVGGLLAGLGLLVLTTPMPIAEWEPDRGSPEVVVVVEESNHAEPPSASPREEPAKYSAPSWQQPIESELLASLQEDLRMPEDDTSQSNASGMTLKEALKRVGSV